MPLQSCKLSHVPLNSKADAWGRKSRLNDRLTDKNTPVRHGSPRTPILFDSNKLTELLPPVAQNIGIFGVFAGHLVILNSNIGWLIDDVLFSNATSPRSTFLISGQTKLIMLYYSVFFFGIASVMAKLADVLRPHAQPFDDDIDAHNLMLMRAYSRPKRLWPLSLARSKVDQPLKELVAYKNSEKDARLIATRRVIDLMEIERSTSLFLVPIGYVSLLTSVCILAFLSLYMFASVTLVAFSWIFQK